MYGIELFDETNMPLEWSTIYYGVKSRILYSEIVRDYIYRKIDADEPLLEQEEALLCYSDDYLECIELLEKMLTPQKKDTNTFEYEKDKIRSAIIMYLRKNEVDVTELLQKMELVYSEFDYPVDMEKFISYMPVKGERNSSDYSLKENREYLLIQMDEFISEKERKYNLNR